MRFDWLLCCRRRGQASSAWTAGSPGSLTNTSCPFWPSVLQQHFWRPQELNTFLHNRLPPTIKASPFHTVLIPLLSMTAHPSISSLFCPSAGALREPLRNINDVCSRGGETKRRVTAWMLADSHSRKKQLLEKPITSVFLFLLVVMTENLWSFTSEMKKEDACECDCGSAGFSFFFKL